MEENESVQVVLDLDIQEAEKTVQSFMDGMESLQDLAKNLGAELKKAFAPLQTFLEKMAISVNSVTAGLSETNMAMKTLMDQMASEQTADHWLGGVSTAIDAIALGTDLLQLIKENGGCLSDTGSVLAESFGKITTKIRECVAAWWQLIAAKVADKAEDLAIIALYVGDFIKGIAAMAAQLAHNTAGWVANTAAKVASTAAEWAQIAATTAWKAICIAATAVTSAFGAAMAVLTSPITLVVAAVAALIAIVVLLIKNWDTVKEVAVKTWNAIVDAFGKAGDWFKRTVLDPVVGGIKGTVNGVIGFINGLISGVVKGINSIINLINRLNFTVPDWIPGIGGETFGFNLTPLTAPQIPYLAKGAVLPANRPFLAVVGDQKYGTNVEAPLATIQEAVALTMEDFTASNLAGHQATVEVLREILEAVLGIRIGDGDIARAVDRYRRKMAVVHGGNW